MNVTEDDRPPADPAASLRLIEQQRAEAGRRLSPDPRTLFWPWGLAWLIGFMLFFLRYGPEGRVFLDMPSWLPLTVLLGLIVAAGVLTAVAGARAGRHVRGASSRQGVMYGLTWSVAFAGLVVVLARVSDLLPEAEATLLWAGATVALTGALHMAGGALWDDRGLFVLGVTISVVNVVGVLAGTGWHSLVVAVAGGGGMLVAGYVGWVRWRR